LFRSQQLVSGLAQDSDPIGNAIPKIATATGDLAQLLQGARPDLQGTIAEANRVATQLNLGEDTVDWVLGRLPSAYKQLIRVGSYGSFFQFYTCAVNLKFT